MEIHIKINEYEAKRLRNLINDGRKILELQGRRQRGIDGYTDGDLDNWDKQIPPCMKCEFANGPIIQGNKK